MLITPPKILYLHFLFLSLSTALQSTNKTTNIGNLEDALYKGFSEVWPFIKQFPTLSDLRLQKSDLYEGIANEGPWTDYSLRKIIDKVLSGSNIHVLIVGESISAGANLGCRNKRRTYHYGLVMWWLKSICSATGSRLNRHQVAVGGVATNYFDRCWKEYLQNNETIDLVIWEFAFNDATAVNQSKSLERFTISVARLPELPGLLFLSFFRKNFFENYVSRKASNPCDKVIEEMEKRHEQHEVTIENVAKYYGVTLIDLERAVCKALSRNSSSIQMQHMFNIDHPSYLAHAQITFILIHYLRGSFAKIVKEMKLVMNKESGSKNATKLGFKRKLYPYSERQASKGNLAKKFHAGKGKRTLPQPLYLSTKEADFYNEPICWTAVLPNINEKPKHDLFDLKTKHSKSFKKITKIDWRDADEKRYDSTGGYITSQANQTIHFSFTIPFVKEHRKWHISLAIRNKFFGGKIKATLRGSLKRNGTGIFDSVEISKDFIDSSTKTYSGVNVYELSNDTISGKKSLKVTTLTGGVHICGIIIS